MHRIRKTVLLWLPALFLAVTSVHADPSLPAISIIIDDIGYRHVDDANALALPGPIAYAIMPHSPHAKKMSQLAAGAGKDIILHMPMEALERDKNRYLGPGALRQDMDETRFIATLVHNLRSVPNIIGVNNHMGSLLSADHVRMGWLMSYLRTRRMFYVDSVTTSESVAAQTAGSLDVPYLRRDVFLDNTLDRVAINARFDELIGVARRKGIAIAIGHPHPETVAVLSARLADLEREGIRLISLKEMVSRRHPASLRKVSLN